VFNSALLVAPDTRILGRYDKQQLLAFGEYIPLQHYVPFLRNISPTIGNLTPGSGGLVTLPNGVSIGALICYEDILPFLGRQAVRQGAQLLVNLTNDAWFGQTRAPYLHRSLAAFRTIENRVYLVRVTNTGLTSIIDALGREQRALPIYQRDTLVHTIQPLQLSTIYTRYGDWFAQLCSVVALLLPWWYRRQTRKRIL
jgi:apolipoprotein N-acyltransferase